MIYNLKVGDKLFDIRCSIKIRPNTVKDLRAGIKDGSITWNEEFKSATEQETELHECKPNDKLETNFERRGATPFYLNWIKFTG